MAKSVFVKDLESGRALDGVFVISRMGLRTYARGQFLSLRLADKTGKVDAVMWDHAEETYERVNTGQPVRVVGKVGQYQDKPQVVVDYIDASVAPDDFDPADFLASAPIDLEEARQDIMELAQTLENEHLLALWEQFTSQEDDLWSRFCQAPGGKMWHHGYLGGLLEHTLSVCRCALRIAEGYPQVDRDLLLSAALYHDISKADEFRYDTFIDYTDSGRLVGHLVMSVMRVEGMIGKIEGFPHSLRNRLLHCMLAHHGQAPQSPAIAMTLEALILHHADEVDAHINAYSREMSKARDAGKDWTDYVNLIGRFLYAGDGQE
jgi:3'-5' exoribonuclease